MGRRKGELYRFPWSKQAKRLAVEMATAFTMPNGRNVPAVPYRTIAADLFSRGYVPALPDPATVRRVVQAERDEARQAKAERLRQHRELISTPKDHVCNGGHGCGGQDCACPCHYGRAAR